ncbi:uncharacterized protein LOC143602476 [Bidens hawaiensis]|uniref:uncharacterized protein LOC143602476 n=1 Tax=Bidens hawaiensis TaxID=980011 RepID=UPI004049582B
MNPMPSRAISTLTKNPNSSVVFRTTSKWTPIPIPHRTIQEPTGQDLDYVNVAHSHLLHSDWSKLDKLLPKLNPFKINHILLKLQTDYSISLKFFKWVQLNNPNLLTLEANSIILHILTKNRKFVSAESVLIKIIGSCDVSVHSKLFDSIINSYRMCDSTPRVFDALFKTYAQMKQFRNATDAFCRMKEYGFLPTVESCNLYMSSLLSMNRAGVAVSFYKEMRRSRMTVNVFTLNMLINGCCQLGKLENARQVFDEMPDMGFSHNVASYNTLIAAYVNKNLLSTAINLKVAMEKNGISPNVITYNTLIHGFCIEGKMHDAYKVFGEMSAMNVAPNAVTYNTMISGYCKLGKVENGTQFFEEMLRNRIKADILTYNAMLLGLCNIGKTRKAAYLVQELDKKKLVPNASTFAALIRGQCVQKNPDRAFELYKSMIKSGCRPNVETIKMMVISFLKNDDFDGASGVFKEVLERPVGPDSVIWSKLCEGSSQVWKDWLVMSLLKELNEGHLTLERFESVKRICDSNADGKEIEQET